MNLQALIRTKRRSLSLSLCYLITLQLCLQTFTIAPVNANLDFWTKLKLLGLLALSKKISIVPIPIALPIPIHIQEKEEVVYVKAPPPISSAYSYSSPMMEYSHVVPRYVRPPKPSSMYSSPKMYHHDMVGHASEIVPVIAEASAPRYGERIVPGAQPAPHAARPAKPISRQRVPHRTRVVVRPKTQSNVEYYQPSPTTQAPPPPPPPSAPIDDDYYKSPYEPEVSKAQVDSIANIPMKSEFTDHDIAQAETPKQPSENSGLPENLLKYIRQVQGLTEKGQSEASGQLSAPVSETAQPTSESAEAVNSGDKWRIIGSNSSESAPIKPSEQPEMTATIAQLPPQQSSISIQHQQHFGSLASSRPATPITPIQSQWQQNFASVGISSPKQYHASEYVYRPPELKVMTNLPRYNPKLDQVRPSVKPIISPLRQSFVGSSNQAAQSFTNSAPVSLQPTQFLYTVTHNNPPSTPFSSYSPPSQYQNLDNFGLTAFRQSQLKPSQSTNPSSYLPSLSASASVESAKWIKPSEKGTKSKFFNNFGHRLSQLF